jgi:spermidine synthase
VRKSKLIDKAVLPSGEELTLSEEAGYFMVRADGMPLMSNMQHHSEEHMAVVGCAGLREKADARVLVGGLGMGYTARAALDQLPPTGEVVVSEISPQLVAWNRGPLADLASRPLEDPRLVLAMGDLVAYLASGPEPFDAILLDVDHGPDSFTAEGNVRLYSRKGLPRLHDCLRPGGVLVIWSAYQAPAFPAALRKAGFRAETVRVRARGTKGGRHTLYVGRRA